jgi:hypothetical protein
MKFTTISLVFALLSFAVGCATPYQSMSFRGGYSDTQLAPDVFRVYFRGNAYTAMERAQDFALLHSAELAQSHGFNCFAVVDESSSTSVHTFTTPGQSYTSGSGTVTGGFVTYSGQTTYYPGQTYIFYKPSTGLLIKCFTEKPKRIYTFDAAFLVQSLRQKYGLK